jgi:hypothetical protein
MTMLSRVLFIALILSATGCAGTDTEPPVADDETNVASSEEAPTQAVTAVEEATAQASIQEGEQGGTGDEEEAVPLLDRTQKTVDSLVLGTVQRVDNIFGSVGVEEEASITRGRLSVGGQYDERDGFRGRFRLKARFQLPALRDRTTLILGRGDANDLIDGTGDDNIDTLPNQFNDFEDEDWLLGFGISRDKTMRRGWSFGVGVKVATPLEPYARATYRWNQAFGEKWFWRVEPRFFVQNQRGAGVSMQNTVDFALSDDWLFRSWSVGVVEEEVDGLSWTSKLIAYNHLTEKSAMSYAVYGSGETQFEVPIKDFGLELRYRRQIAREWLFIELLTRLNWPRETLDEVRETNIGVGIEFELQFGSWPGRGRPRDSAIPEAGNAVGNP